MDSLSWTKRMAQCVGKEAFSTPQIASKVLCRTRWDKGRKKRHVYHCQFCGRFHIGDNRKSRQPAPADRKRWRFVAMEESDA